MRALASRRREPTRTISFERIGGTQDTGNNAADFRVRRQGSRRTSTWTGGPADPAPSVTASDPANFANNVDRNTTIRITFSEPVNVSDAAFSLACNGTAIPFGVTRESATASCSIPRALPRERTAPSASRAISTTTRTPTTRRTPARTSPPRSRRPASRACESTTSRAPAPLAVPRPIVAGVPGVVTATRFNGFYIQDPKPDRDDRTSEGIFVFTGSPVPAAAVGRRRRHGLRPRDRVPPGLHADVRGAELPGRLRLVHLPAT